VVRSKCLNRIVRSFRDKGVNNNEILDYLEFSEDYSNFFEAIQVPQQTDGMSLVDRRGRPISKYYLLERWNGGLDAGALKASSPEFFAEVWALALPMRQTLWARWNPDILQDRVAGIQDLVKKYNETQDLLSKLHKERSVSLTKSKRIVGCTTTTAAMHSRELRSASPGVLLVEEAGEILECHTLTALTPNTKQLILIGNHKQLRPKINKHALSVEKEDGYDLNKSLFERLIQAGIPHTTFLKQHRMCPELSKLVRRSTCPNLIDAPSTANRPPLRGLQDRLVFFNQDYPEVEFLQIAEQRDPETTLSKQNVFEVETVLKCARYLGQQGYGTDKLVILTPYLGQLQLLLTKLRESADPVLNDLDSFDLVRAGLLPAASADVSKPKIRISTIGNGTKCQDSELVCLPVFVQTTTKEKKATS